MAQDGGRSNDSDRDTAPPFWKRRSLIFASLLVLMGASGALVYVFFLMPPAKLDVWANATVPYSAGCGAACQEWQAVSTGHGGAPAADRTQVPRLVYNPRVNDPIAQWADCLQSVMVCVRQQPRDNLAGVNGCVRNAQCPAPCKDRYFSQAGTTMDSAEAALFGVFIDKDAVCRPEGDAS